jgi:hypothetical protein
MKYVRFALVPLVVVALAAPAVGELIEWRFTMDESQIKNGPEPDGSTDSPGTGSGWITYDTQTNVIAYSFTWHDLFGELTKLHVHGPATPDQSNPQHVLEVFGPPDIPDGVDLRSDTWTDSFELMTLIQPDFDPLSPTQIIDIMRSGQAYVNVHTSVFGVGEIRGNLGLPIPEPSNLCLAAIAVAMLLATQLARRRPQS